ncbi:MAG: methylenetetrahydrofolate reductase [NAD(P)H] [Actinomycetota bacterium]|nr:methylenetetrahydrofolate reductase [NAD(P)H] [Nocardioidaceae bacterium]MDQ3592445.1 methylenetetrahydrofolate reductase [NAD(P)H] [Actinomycetota bacterium]
MTPEPDDPAGGREQRLSAVFASGRRSFSFEFFPPKDDAGERQLWTTIRQLEPLEPTFVSVTYGAGGSTRDRTVRITERIAEETTLRPVAHLTCVGHDIAELRGVVGQYADAGVRDVLALRGDPSEGPGSPWQPHPGGLDRAVQLVSLVKSLGDFDVGVAAFPEKHPEAADLEADAQFLVDKAQAGADYAVTQLFFRAEDYLRLVDRVRVLGCELPIVPGIMPITSLTQVQRFATLSGSQVPPEVVDRLSPYADDPRALRSAGVELAIEMCDRLLGQGAPGLHYYTLNRSTATREIHAGLGVHA